MIDKQELLALLNDPEVVNTIHQVSDVDRSTLGQHHSLGKQNNQAAPGPHIHGGGNSLEIPVLKPVVDWTGLSYASGFSGSVEFKKIGDLVFLQGTISPNAGSFTTGANITVANANAIPVAFRPGVARVIPVPHTWGGGAVVSVCRATIGTDGSIIITNIQQTSVTTAWFTGSYAL